MSRFKYLENKINELEKRIFEIEADAHVNSYVIRPNRMRKAKFATNPAYDKNGWGKDNIT